MEMSRSELDLLIGRSGWRCVDISQQEVLTDIAWMKALKEE